MPIQMGKINNIRKDKIFLSEPPNKRCTTTCFLPELVTMRLLLTLIELRYGLVIRLN